LNHLAFHLVRRHAWTEIKPLWLLMREELLRSAKLFVEEAGAHASSIAPPYRSQRAIAAPAPRQQRKPRCMNARALIAHGGPQRASLLGTCHAWPCLQHKMYVNREALRPVHDLNMGIAMPGWILHVFTINLADAVNLEDLSVPGALQKN
jgi:hypothetical protein